MVLLALSFLTSYFYYIPRATLAAVLISAVLFMIDVKIIKLLWKGSRNKYMMLKPENCLYYPAVASFCEKVMSLAGNNVPLIMNCEIFNSLDYTSIKGIETLSKKLNSERNQFWLLHLNSNVVKSFDILADNKYIRLIEKEESIADVLYNDALSSKNSEDRINITMKQATEMKNLNREDLLYSNSRQNDSESNAEELALMSPSECKIQQ
ncbi:Sodium-independent sulfate anion transporter [Acromyrmex echinatior]|uniref:Sodium-independent sulfate anion transporter n=1 Tax=Acromyrmex echinatior TaxID=103372 RepID=F4X7K7_ACREC|nr:Sodium-independent sulfate anion transporter [Acromyrmex echinatior]